MKLLSLRPYLVRTFIVGIVLGLPFMGFLAYRVHIKAPTDSQKRAALYASIDQTYLLGSQIASYSDHSPLASDNLNALASQFDTSLAETSTALSRVSNKQFPASKRSQVQQFVTTQQHAMSSFTAARAILIKPLAYDPSHDIGLLDTRRDTNKLAARSLAAQKGLLEAARNKSSVAVNSGALVAQNSQVSSSIIASDTARQLSAESDCFGRLALELSARQLDKATDTRAVCIREYPSLRSIIIQNIQDVSFNAQSISDTKSTVQSLLKP